MGHIRIHFLLCITFLLVVFTCSEAETISSTESQKIQNLRAFAKLYGYVKYFHPSDEANAIDWDKFAIYGAKQVKDAKDTEELKTALEVLFLPIAPTIQIYTSDQKPEGPKKHVPDDTTGLKIVAWQHLGFGSRKRPYRRSYRSIRLNRKNRVPVGGGNYAHIVQSVGASEHRGKLIRLKAFARTNVNGFANQGELWLEIEREGGKPANFDVKTLLIKAKRPWQAYEIVRKVPDDAKTIHVICSLRGMGQIWADEFELLVMDEKDEWRTIEIENSGFEEGDENNKPLMWNMWSTGAGYTCKINTAEPYKGDKCLLIEDKSEVFSGKLFEKHPNIGEVVNKPLDSGLFCQIPLALYSDEHGTIGKNDSYPFATLSAQLEKIDIYQLTPEDQCLRLADVIIAWNVFQHFYPYFDVVDVDWDSELTDALRRAMRDRSREDFLYTLRRLIARLQDGHGGVGLRWHLPRVRLPIEVDWIENQVVITAAANSIKLRNGDVIISVDGVRAEEALSNDEESISGSPQWKRYKALGRFGSGEPGTMASLLIRRGSRTFKVDVERGNKHKVSKTSKPIIDEIQDGVYYVDLTKAAMKEIDEMIDTLAKARGVVFDVRGYPNSNHDVICNLLRKEDISDSWMRVPQIIYPDFENVVGYQNYSWGLKPKQPRIKGKVVFLTDGRAISYAESFMSFIEHYRLGEIVGQPTAGTNGNLNTFALPGEYGVIWTGMKVVKHDGSQHHLIGIQPTVPVQRTIHGVIEGRDEFLEKALEIINKK